jgi:hypothetical protein
LDSSRCERHEPVYSDALFVCTANGTGERVGTGEETVLTTMQQSIEMHGERKGMWGYKKKG